MNNEIQINWLSIVRVVATLMIVTVHFGQSLPLPHFMHAPIVFCQTAVCVFFILTGYFTEVSLGHSKSSKDYYKKRIARIIPVYYSVIIVNIVASLLIRNYPSDVTHLGWLRFFTFTHGIVPSNEYSNWNNGAALWTMSGFCVFYILAPVIHKVFEDNKKGLILLWGGVLLAIVSEKVFIALSRNQSIYSESLEYLATHSVFFVFYEMLLGVYIYKVDKSKGASILPILLIAAYGRIFKDQWLLDTAVYGLIVYIISTVSAPNIESGVIKQIFHIIGEYSYSIYLGHTTVMFIFSRLQERIGYSNLVLGALDIIGCVIFIPILHNLIEKPVWNIILARNRKG